MPRIIVYNHTVHVNHKKSHPLEKSYEPHTMIPAIPYTSFLYPASPIPACSRNLPCHMHCRSFSASPDRYSYKGTSEAGELPLRKPPAWPWKYRFFWYRHCDSQSCHFLSSAHYKIKYLFPALRHQAYDTAYFWRLCRNNSHTGLCGRQSSRV